MPTCGRFIILSVLLALFAGCTVSRSRSGTYKFKWRVWETILSSLDRDDAPVSDADALWRNGYGFNNPNIERRRSGLAPLNFDGSVHRD